MIYKNIFTVIIALIFSCITSSASLSMIRAREEDDSFSISNKRLHSDQHLTNRVEHRLELCKLGSFYETGEVFALDFNEAYKWYSFAAQNNSIHAQCVLGMKASATIFQAALDIPDLEALQEILKAQERFNARYFDRPKIFEAYKKAIESGQKLMALELINYVDQEDLLEAFEHALKTSWDYSTEVTPSFVQTVFAVLIQKVSYEAVINQFTNYDKHNLSKTHKLAKELDHEAMAKDLFAILMRKYGETIESQTQHIFQDICIEPLALASILTTNNTLSSIKFSCCDLGPKGARALAQVLGGNTTLLELSISESIVGSSEDTARAFICSLGANNTLEKLSISYSTFFLGNGENIFADILNQNRGLRKLKLILSVSITKEQFQALAQALKNNSTLEEFVIYSNNGDSGTTSDGAALVADILKTSSLRKLTIDYPFLPDPNLEDLFLSALSQNSYLEVFYIVNMRDDFKKAIKQHTYKNIEQQVPYHLRRLWPCMSVVMAGNESFDANSHLAILPTELILEIIKIRIALAVTATELDRTKSVVGHIG